MTLSGCGRDVRLLVSPGRLSPSHYQLSRSITDPFVRTRASMTTDAGGLVGAARIPGNIEQLRPGG